MGSFLCYTISMKNTHIEHPEDSILTGDLSVLNWFIAKSNISAKIDGAPAIVWGTNPANGKFFVGTKSVFNKVKIKINHSHEEIDTTIKVMLPLSYINALTIYHFYQEFIKVISLVSVVTITTHLTP